MPGITSAGQAALAAEGRKTPAQVAVYGGTAGEQYDPCYHAVCDILGNFSAEVLDLNSDAVALATLTHAMSTDTVTGVAAASPLAAAAAAGTATTAGQLAAA